MNIVQICNNYAKSDDGIGSYVATLVNSQGNDNRFTIVSARCPASLNYIDKIRHNSMSRAVDEFIESMDGILRCDAIVLDYPFVELNPLFLHTYRELSKCAKSKGKPLILSLHEYERCNLIRKAYILYMIKKCDAVLVTTQEMKEDISRYINNNNIYLRPIVSNIRIEEIVVSKNKNAYVYFGMVNKAKAFSEMLEAWSKAGIKEGELRVISASDVSNQVEAVRNTKMYYDASEKLVSNVLQESAFCILPILPEVDQRNTSFISAINAGCICIGKFCAEFSELPFVVNIKDYSPNTIMRAIRKLSQIGDEDIARLSSRAREYSRRFSTECAVKQYIDTIQNIIDRY